MGTCLNVLYLIEFHGFVLEANNFITVICLMEFFKTYFLRYLQTPGQVLYVLKLFQGFFFNMEYNFNCIN